MPGRVTTSNRLWAAPGSGERPGAAVASPEVVGLDRDYPLSACEAFLVESFDGRHLGVVDEIEFDPETGRAVKLVLVAGWFGRSLLELAADCVQIVLPSERRLLVVDPGCLRPRPHRHDRG